MKNNDKGFIESWNFIPNNYPPIGEKVFALIDSHIDLDGNFEPFVAEVYYFGRDDTNTDTWATKNIIDEESYITQEYNILMWRKK